MHIYILGLAKGWTDSEAAGETEEREKKTKNSTSWIEDHQHDQGGGEEGS